MTSDAGALLLGATDRAIGLIRRFAACFHDERRQDLIEHEVATLVGQRVFAIALGYEDLNDHDELRHDPLMGVLAGKLAARRADCAAVAGKSTLNRLELSRLELTRYHKISHNPMAIRHLFVDMFLEAHGSAPRQIILDLDATDDPVHGEQEGRFFHGYYDCYCYLPLYVFCGEHLLLAKLRPANVDAAAGAVEEVARLVARIRARWPRTRILLRADSGFARDDLMTWCEESGVDFLFGLAKNARLIAAITPELERAAAKSRRTGKPERRFKSFMWRTRTTWSRRRHVVAKAECTQGEANPRFVVTSLTRAQCKPKYLYEKVYCARGDMENKIKVRHRVAKSGPGGKAIPGVIALHTRPEFAYRLQAPLWRVAGDQARIDGADRGADDPIRFDTCLVQGLINPDLVSPERTPSLQHEHDLAARTTAERFDRFRPFELRWHATLRAASIGRRSLTYCKIAFTMP